MKNQIVLVHVKLWIALLYAGIGVPSMFFSSWNNGLGFAGGEVNGTSNFALIDATLLWKHGYVCIAPNPKRNKNTNRSSYPGQSCHTLVHVHYIYIYIHTCICVI